MDEQSCVGEQERGRTSLRLSDRGEPLSRLLCYCTPMVAVDDIRKGDYVVKPWPRRVRLLHSGFFEHPKPDSGDLRHKTLCQDRFLFAVLSP